MKGQSVTGITDSWRMAHMGKIQDPCKKVHVGIWNHALIVCAFLLIDRLDQTWIDEVCKFSSVTP